MAKRKSIEEQAMKPTFRVPETYHQSFIEQCKARKLNPHEFAKQATISAVTHKFLDTNSRIQKMEKSMLRMEFATTQILKFLKNQDAISEETSNRLSGYEESKFDFAC